MSAQTEDTGSFCTDFECGTRSVIENVGQNEVDDLTKIAWAWGCQHEERGTEGHEAVGPGVFVSSNKRTATIEDVKNELNTRAWSYLTHFKCNTMSLATNMTEKDIKASTGLAELAKSWGCEHSEREDLRNHGPKGDGEILPPGTVLPQTKRTASIEEIFEAASVEE